MRADFKVTAAKLLRRLHPALRPPQRRGEPAVDGDRPPPAQGVQAQRRPRRTLDEAKMAFRKKFDAWPTWAIERPVEAAWHSKGQNNVLRDS